MKTNITEEMKTTCTNRYFDSVSYSAAEILARLLNDLQEADAELIGANLVNAYRRHEKAEADKPIFCTPASYIKYTLNGHVVYIEFGRFWVFDGVRVDAQPIDESGNSYRYTKFALNVPATTEEGYNNLLAYAKNPGAAYAEQERIPTRKPEDREYVSRGHKIEKQFYYR